MADRVTFSGKYMTAAMAVLLSGGAALSSSGTLAAQAPMQAAPAAAMAAPVPAISAAPAPIRTMAPVVEEGDPVAPQPVATAAAGDDAMDSELECLAKVVRHEAANQSRTGQVGVAEVVMNRVRHPHFPKTICGVVTQRGQFFNVHAYRPSRSDAMWRTAVDVARAVRSGDETPVTNGGLFFRTSYGAPFAGRAHSATIGVILFYR